MLDAKGTLPCHLEVDYDNNLLFASNYGSGTFTAYRIDESTGVIKKEVAVFNYGKGSGVYDFGFQDNSHAHAAYKFKNYVFVMDLGSDRIWRYKVKMKVFFKSEYFMENHT